MSSGGGSGSGSGSGSSSSESSLASPNKRLKTLADVAVDDDDDDEQAVCCGICYAERGVSIAGEIDCCNHYFCFVCIMEWAKHESRCPICRQRFSNVRRPAKLGLFSSSRDVKVPLRDQAYHPLGNMTTGPVGSYAEVKCSVCHGGTDENLLLICDLCDTASHTYCVGLGYTVPEGDWFCHDCAVSRETNADKDLEQQNVVLTAEPGVTIFDIVREPGSRVVRRSRASSLQQNQSSSSIVPLPNRLSRFKGKNHVSGSQHVQRNIQALRENWSALRSGSLRFRCNSSQPGDTGSQKQDSSSLRGKSGESYSVASTSLKQPTVQGGPSSNTLNERGLEDIDKAWKMMNRAKMMQQTHQRTSSIRQGVDQPSCRGGTRKISSAHCNYQDSKNQQSRTLDQRYSRIEKQCDYSSLNKNLENRWSSKLGEEKQSSVTCEEMVQHVRDHTIHLEGYYEPPLPKEVHTNIQGVPCHEDGERNVLKEQSWSACLVTSVGSAPSHGRLASAISSSTDVGIFNEEKRLAKSVGDGNTRKSEDAKTEIQSLVKLNLKVLTGDKQLGVETFKVIARQATHTILAACRSEQQGSNIYSSSSVCSHTDHTTQFQKSTLMPNCCRQCFYVFVNDVVNSIMLEKVGCA